MSDFGDPRIGPNINSRTLSDGFRISHQGLGTHHALLMDRRLKGRAVSAKREDKVHYKSYSWIIIQREGLLVPPSVSGPWRYKALETRNALVYQEDNYCFRVEKSLPLVFCAKWTIPV